MAGGGAISHDRCEAAWNAGRALARGISRAECAHLCEVRREARRVVLQSGRGEPAGRWYRAGVVPPALFSCAHVLRGARWLHSLPVWQEAPEIAQRIAVGLVSSF